MLADYQLVALMALQFQLEDERYQRTIPGPDYVILDQDVTCVHRPRRAGDAARERKKMIGPPAAEACFPLADEALAFREGD